MDTHERAKSKNHALPIIIFFLLMLCVIVVGIFIQVFEMKSVEDLSKEQLLSIANLKIDRINSWMDERKSDANSIMNNLSFQRDINSYMKDKNDKTIENRLKHILISFKEKDYYDVFLIDKDYKVLYSSGGNDRLADHESGLMKEALKQKKFVISDLHFEHDTTKLHIGVAIPCFYNGEQSGFILLKIDPKPFVYPFISTWPIKSRTAETLICEQRGDSVLFLNELRHSQNTAGKLYIPLTSKNVLAVRAVMGFRGVDEGVDYRGVKVLGAVIKVPDTNWFLVTKIDKQEVLEEVKNRFWIINIVIVILIFSSSTAFWYYMKNVKKKEYTLLLENELEKKKADAEIKASELKFQALFNSMKEGVAIHKLVYNENGEAIDYYVTDINSSFEKNTGISIEQAKGTLASKLYDMPVPPYLDIYTGVAKSGVECDFETYFPPLKRHFRISVTCPGEDMFATIFLDITEAKLHEEQLKKFVENLEQSNKELEQFAYVASHDLQEPLRMVSSFTQLLAKKYKGQLSEEADGYINYAVDGATRMQTLINDLLEYSRVTRKGKPFSKTDSNSALGQAVANLRKKIEETRAIVSNSELPEIVADELQITRIFQNLIDNALKYKSADWPVIIVSSEELSEEWKFSVKDNGIGIDPEYKDRIFEIFERLHSSSKYPGTGIGLAICKKIVERHGGKIWVEPNPEKGVTFYFTIMKREITNADQ